MKDLAALLKYAEQFRSLHTSFTQANNRAPHKFILLYSLCLLYESGSLHTEKIDFSDTLLEEWQAIFRQQWQRWVANAYHQENFGMPLYHMRTEPFWYQTWYGRCIRTKKPHEGFIQPASNCFGRRNRCTTRTAASAGRNSGGAAGCAVGTIV